MEDKYYMVSAYMRLHELIPWVQRAEQWSQEAGKGGLGDEQRKAG